MNGSFANGRPNAPGCGRLIIPTSFEDALSYGQQVEWLNKHKQNTLVAGDNITLTRNEDGTYTISGTDFGPALATLSQEITALEQSKQNTLVAGDNITLTRNENGTYTISGTDYSSAISALDQSKQNTLVAGDNITLTRNENGTYTIASSGGGSSLPTPTNKKQILGLDNQSNPAWTYPTSILGLVRFNTGELTPDSAASTYFDDLDNLFFEFATTGVAYRNNRLNNAATIEMVDNNLSLESGDVVTRFDIEVVQDLYAYDEYPFMTFTPSSSFIGCSDYYADVAALRAFSEPHINGCRLMMFTERPNQLYPAVAVCNSQNKLMIQPLVDIESDSYEVYVW